MDEADPQGRRRVEPLAGEEVPARRGADLRQDERRDHRRDDAELDLREAEDRVLGRERDVRARDETRAAAERVPLDAGDDGRRARVDGLQHAVEAEGVLDVLVVAQVDRGALPLDVGAGAEARPLAGEHDRARVADVGEGVGELGDQRRVEGVPPLRARQRDAEDGVVTLDAEGLHGGGA